MSVAFSGNLSPSGPLSSNMSDKLRRSDLTAGTAYRITVPDDRRQTNLTTKPPSRHEKPRLIKSQSLEERSCFSLDADLPQSDLRQEGKDFVNGSLQSFPLYSNGSDVKTIHDSEPIGQQCTEAQRQPQIPSSATGLGPRSTEPSVPQTNWLEEKFQTVRTLQESLSTNFECPPQWPKNNYFAPLDTTILERTRESVKHCVILLHDSAAYEISLRPLAEALSEKSANTAFILLRGPQRGARGCHWADSESGRDESFIRSTEVILKSVIMKGLINLCYFHPKNIMILGYGQGGTAALAAAACWNTIEFGGVIAIGSSVPSCTRSFPSSQVMTPALILGGTDRAIGAAALQEVEAVFASTENHVSSHHALPKLQADLEPLLSFLTHRLKHDEWNKQAVITFGRTAHPI